MEINTKIEKIVQALGKDSNKLYWQVETSEGRMTCHEKGVIDELMEFMGGMCNLSVRETPKSDGNGVWRNIIGIAHSENGITYLKPKTQENAQTLANKSITNVEVEVKPVIKDKISYIGKNNDDKHTTMYVSYAKDIFVAMINSKLTTDNLIQDMKTAIDLVKQAKEAFK